ncbi:MAG: hypothetical protein ACMUEM_07900 [Flavobacteriales bacterium AspAUS03]
MNFLIFATGYQYEEPRFLQGIPVCIVRRANQLYDVQCNYTIDIHGDEIFVQNPELYTHGFITLAGVMKVYRNACIINTLTGIRRFIL